MSASTGLAAHLSYYLHVPFGATYGALEVISTLGSVAACLEFAFICPFIYLAFQWYTQLGLVGAALA